MAENITKNESDSFFYNLHAYANAAYPFLWITSFEEERLERSLIECFIKKSGNRKVRHVVVWEMFSDAIKYKEGDKYEVIQSTKGPVSFLNYLDKVNSDVMVVYLVKRAHLVLANSNNWCSFLNIKKKLLARGSLVIFTGQVQQLPIEMSRDIQIADFNLPTPEMIKSHLHSILKSSQEATTKPEEKNAYNITPELEFDAVQAATGLTAQEIDNAYSLAVIKAHGLNSAFVKVVSDEKITILKKTSHLNYLQPDIKFDQIGGLSNLKKWIYQRAKAFEPKAREYGLPYPRGILLNGPQGCGKTVLAKATAHELNVPLFALDIGDLYGSLVGSTEANFRKMIKVVDSLGKCVLFID